MEIKQSLVCQMCQRNNYPYRNNGLCVWQAATKESNPGEKLPECEERE